MPTYEYRCPQGHEFEQFFPKISDSKSALPCPKCGEVAERRISGGAGLLFKGSGFYITDYGKDGKKDVKTGAGKPEGGEGAAAASSDGKGAGDAKSSDSKAKDAKPAAPAAAPAKPPSSGGGE